MKAVNKSVARNVADAPSSPPTLAGRPYTFIAKRYTFTYTRMRMELDHEKLDVYRAALDFAAWTYPVCRTLKGLDRPTRKTEFAKTTSCKGT